MQKELIIFLEADFGKVYLEQKEILAAPITDFKQFLEQLVKRLGRQRCKRILLFYQPRIFLARVLFFPFESRKKIAKVLSQELVAKTFLPVNEFELRFSLVGQSKLGQHVLVLGIERRELSEISAIFSQLTSKDCFFTLVPGLCLAVANFWIQNQEKQKGLEKSSEQSKKRDYVLAVRLDQRIWLCFFKQGALVSVGHCPKSSQQEFKSLLWAVEKQFPDFCPEQFFVLGEAEKNESDFGFTPLPDDLLTTLSQASLPKELNFWLKNDSGSNKWRGWLWLSLGSLLCLALAIGSSIYFKRKKLLYLEKQIQTVVHKRFQNLPKLTPRQYVSVFKAKLAQLKSGVDRGLAWRPSDFLLFLTENVPLGITLDQISFNSGQVTIRGKFAEQKNLFKLKSKLSKYEAVNTVTLKITNSTFTFILGLQT